MSKIIIDEVEYETDNMSNDAKAQLNMIAISEQEIKRLNAMLAIAQTARVTYGKALKELLKGEEISAAEVIDKKKAKH